MYFVGTCLFRGRFKRPFLAGTIKLERWTGVAEIRVRIPASLNLYRPSFRKCISCKCNCCYLLCPVEPRLTATSVIRSPRYYCHFFWPGTTVIHFPIKTLVFIFLAASPLVPGSTLYKTGPTRQNRHATQAKQVTIFLACENIRFSSLSQLGTFRLFSQATIFLFLWLKWNVFVQFVTERQYSGTLNGMKL